MTRRWAGLAGLMALPLLVLGVFFVLPVSGMLQLGFWPEGRFDPGAVGEVLTRSRTLGVIWFTVWSATAATVIALLLGLPAAYALYRLDFPGRTVVRAALLVPFVLPTVVAGVAFRQLIGDSGPLGLLGLDGTPVAILAALVFFNASVVIRTVGAAWESLDRRPAEAAAALGATPAQVFRTVTWPALRPAITSAGSVVFCFCATAYGVVLILGGIRYASVETEIYLLTLEFLDLPGAAALSLVQLLAITVLLAVAARVRRTPDPTVQRVVTPAARPRRGDAAPLAVTALLLGLVAAPIVALVIGSLRGRDGWTLASYRALSGVGADGTLEVDVWQALLNSLRYAVDATWISLSLGLMIAVAVTRRSRSRGERRLRTGLDGLFMLPLGVSAVTLGFGFQVTLDQPPLDLRASPLIVPIAQALVALPLVVRVLVPVLAGIDPRQRQAAASLGAGPLRGILTVDLPVIWRPLLAAAGFTFAVALGEFGATSFLARADEPTLPTVIYRLISRPDPLNYQMSLAACVLLAAVTAGVMLLVERLRVPTFGAM